MTEPRDTRADRWIAEHEHALDHDLERHSDTCYLTGCVDCREERMLRGLDVPPLPVPEYIRERQASFDDEGWRVGGDSFEEHFHGIVRPERVEPSARFL